jgi:mRNA interferase RelE/StbE
MAKWEVKLTATAKAHLREIKDKRVQQTIYKRLRKLEENPEQQGKALIGELAGYRSVRAVGQRYRIIYKVLQDRVVVMVVGLGIRKEGDKNDIYTKALFLLNKGLLDPTQSESEKDPNE